MKLMLYTYTLYIVILIYVTLFLPTALFAVSNPRVRMKVCCYIMVLSSCEVSLESNRLLHNGFVV